MALKLGTLLFSLLTQHSTYRHGRTYCILTWIHRQSWSFEGKLMSHRHSGHHDKSFMDKYYSTMVDNSVLLLVIWKGLQQGTCMGSRTGLANAIAYPPSFHTRISFNLLPCDLCFSYQRMWRRIQVKAPHTKKAQRIWYLLYIEWHKIPLAFGITLIRVAGGDLWNLTKSALQQVKVQFKIEKQISLFLHDSRS